MGYDNIDSATAREHGIPVCNVPDYGTEEVADSALGMMLALGETGQPDLVQATKWFTLASKAGDESAKQAQATLADKMTPSQVAEGQKLAETWIAAHKGGK